MEKVKISPLARLFPLTEYISYAMYEMAVKDRNNMYRHRN